MPQRKCDWFDDWIKALEDVGDGVGASVEQISNFLCVIFTHLNFITPILYDIHLWGIMYELKYWNLFIVWIDKSNEYYLEKYSFCTWLCKKKIFSSLNLTPRDTPSSHLLDEQSPRNYSRNVPSISINRVSIKYTSIKGLSWAFLRWFRRPWWHRW